MSSQVAAAPREEFLAVTLSLAVGVVLLAIKFTAYFLTGSAAIFSDAVESIANVAAAAVALYSIRLAHSPADSCHPYGHGKAEFLSGWFEASLIVLAALFIVVNTVDQLWHGSHLQEGKLGVGLVLMALSMAVNGATGALLVRLGRRRGSLTLEADGKHLLTDVASTGGVVVSLLVVRFTGLTWVDPLTALLLAAWIAVVGLRLMRRAAAGLMDEQDVEDERVITAILDAHRGHAGREPQICSFHKLRHRHSGRYHWVDFHLRLPEATTVRHAHDVATAIEREIEAALGLADATAHVEPCGRAVCPAPGRCVLIAPTLPVVEAAGADAGGRSSARA